VSELEDAWESVLAEAHRKAQSAGRADIAEYLRLRASNDLSRRAGIDWLLSSFEKLAGEANRNGASLQMSREASHRFAVHNSTMVGPRLTLSFGVRSLSIEAGWPRVPGDRFVRGGGLAHARIKHFGKERLNQELLLVKVGDASPSWIVLSDTQKKEPFRESGIQDHLTKLLSHDYR
jgi:hypothetical protein